MPTTGSAYRAGCEKALRLACALALLAAMPVPARAEADAERPGEAPALELHAAYTAEVWHNSGGERRGWRYLDNLDVTAELDLDRATGWQGATAFAYVLYNNGRSVSELAGDTQAISNIETGVEAVRLFEAWIEQDLGSGASAKFGLYDLNSEFDALEASALFIGSAHGIGTDISQSGEAGPSIFPVTSFALRLQAQVHERVALRVAVLDGVPGNPDHPRRTAIKLGHGDGALLIGEADMALGDVRVLASGWGYTARQERLDGTGKASSHGAYLRAESVLHEGASHRLLAFGRAGWASGEANPFGTFLSGGVLLSLEDAWEFGAAIAHARTSRAARRTGPMERAETVLELTMAKQLAQWLSVQPDLQYVIDPGAIPGRNNALAVGLRVTAGF